jgi:hypothetical protein
VTLFCLSNNSDVGVTGSAVSTLCASPTCRLLLSFSLSLSLPLLFLFADEISRSIGSLSCADSEGLTN